MLDSRRNILLACALSALAGYVDGIGFLHLGGLFVSFMSGNSTRMGVSLADGQWSAALEAFSLIVLFVVGAAAGSLIVLGRAAHRQALLLLTEALLLVAAALAYHLGLQATAVAAIVLAMGLENAVFQIDGGGGLGLTYVTGALVKVGQLLGVSHDRRSALGLAAQPAALRRPGRRRRRRRARLQALQSRRDLDCGRRGARAGRDDRCDRETGGLTAATPCSMQGA